MAKINSIKLLKNLGWVHSQSTFTTYFDKYDLRLMNDISNPGYWIIRSRNNSKNYWSHIEDQYIIIGRIEDSKLRERILQIEREFKLKYLLND